MRATAALGAPDRERGGQQWRRCLSASLLQASMWVVRTELRIEHRDGRAGGGIGRQLRTCGSSFARRIFSAGCRAGRRLDADMSCSDNMRRLSECRVSRTPLANSQLSQGARGSSRKTEDQASFSSRAVSTRVVGVAAQPWTRPAAPAAHHSKPLRARLNREPPDARPREARCAPKCEDLRPANRAHRSTGCGPRELTRGCAPGPPARLQRVDKSCH